jgi:hypothetical protein
MKVLLEIDNPEELEKFSQFLKEQEEAKTAERIANRKKTLSELKNKIKIHLPPGYRFNRDEIYDRQGLR